MTNICNYRGNSKENAGKRNIKLLRLIDNFCKNKELKKILNIISNKLNVPTSYLLQDVKIYLHRNYSTKKMKFSNKLNLFYLPISMLSFFLFFIYISIFSSKRKIKKIKTELLIDEILHKREAEKFSELKKFFKKTLFIIYRKFDTKYQSYSFLNYRGLNKNLLFNKVPELIFSLFFISTIFSIKKRVNIFHILIFLISQIFKYKNIFSNIKGKYLIQERHYATSAIKSFLFKKSGGKSFSVFQKVIPQLMGPGTYAYADIFFTLGNETHRKAIVSSGNFKKIIPVGSLFMENIFFQKKIRKKIDFDLLNVISDGPNFSDGFKNYEKNWIEHLSWLKKLSDEDKKLKIVIKRRPNDKLDKNNFLNDFFKNSGVQIIFGETPLNKEYSYEHCMRSKVVCTWSSTMGYELIGHNKPCIFMDPNGENLSFVPSDELHKPIKVTNYKEFRRKFYIYKENKNKFFKKIKKENFCLKSNKVSERVFKSLKQYSFK